MVSKKLQEDLSKMLDDGASVSHPHFIPDEDSELKFVLDQVLINGLLEGMFETPNSREQRIQKVLDKFVEHRDRKPNLGRKPQQINRRLLMTLTSVSASIVIVAFLAWLASAPSAAEAAVERTIRSFQVEGIWSYECRIKSDRFPNASRQCTLYRRSVDEFVASFNTPRRRRVSVGSNGEMKWLRINGRVLTSEDEDYESRLGGAFLDRVSIRHFQLGRLVHSIPDDYETKLLDEEPLPASNDGAVCRPILAVLKSESEMLPSTIKIWSHPSSGVVHRAEILVRRNPSHNVSIELELSGKLIYKENFFMPENW